MDDLENVFDEKLGKEVLRVRYPDYEKRFYFQVREAVKAEGIDADCRDDSLEIMLPYDQPRTDVERLRVYGQSLIKAKQTEIDKARESKVIRKKTKLTPKDKYL